MELEAQLKEYRELRRRQHIIDKAKAKLEESKEVPKPSTNMQREKQEDQVVLLQNVLSPSRVLIQPDEDEGEVLGDGEVESLEKSKESWKYFITKWTIYFIIWLTIYIIFLKLQFGAVYFVLSMLVGIYLNTRTRPKKIGEVSAYSVFNENCVSIEGTLNAEQFEKEIRYGPGTV